MRSISFALFLLACFTADIGAWGGGHKTMTEAAIEVQPNELRELFAGMHRNEFTGKDATLEWYLINRFCSHPDWVDGPTRDEADIPERIRSTQFVYGSINGKYYPPIAYTDPDKDLKKARPKSYHYFTYKTEEVNREFARSGADWYFKRLEAAIREGRNADAAEFLGAFLHAIQDRVSPYHVWDGYTEKREALETEYADDGLQSPEGSRTEKSVNASLFWALGGEGMDNSLPEGYKPNLMGTTREEAVETFVERLFETRADAERVYADEEGFMKEHLADDWKDRKTSEQTRREMAAAAETNVQLCADVIFTAWRLAGEAVTLADSGVAKLVISINENAGEDVEATARDLAGKLTAITGSEFPITKREVSPAIILRVVSEPRSTMERDRYSIRTSAEEGLVIEGDSETAVQHAVWDLLHRIGYRQYFPGETWEVIPEKPTLSVTLNIEESPAYASRRIWYGHGFWDHNKEVYFDWVKKNRLAENFDLNTGHAYHQLIRSQQSSFNTHPEYYALVDGERRVGVHSKFCISNPGVIDAAKRYGLEFFEKNPDADSVSVDPSDGGDWCECEECVSLGTPSDRALILANAVAEAVTADGIDDRYVGMYAYNYHSQPPGIQVHPNVIISVATAFIKEGMKFEDIASGWAEKGAIIGVREYYSVNTWDRDLPGSARGSNLNYLAETIPEFYEIGARFLSAESSDNWGCNGLGYYFASRLLWDLEEAEKREEIIDDFLVKCFGPAKEPMAEFYTLIDGSNKRARLVYEDLLARMFGHLSRARELASGEPKILRRIDDLVLYTRHAELFDAYRTASGPERQAAYEAMIRHAFRIRDTYMVHSYALYRDVHRRDKAIELPEAAFWKIPEQENPWKNGQRYSETEILKMLTDGLSNHETVELDFEAREYSEGNLVPASGILTLPEVSAGECATGRGKRSWFTIVDSAPAKIELAITGGLIEHYRDRGNVRVGLFKLGGPSATGEDETFVAEDASVPPDGKKRSVSLVANEPGLYRIDLDDGSDMTRVTWPTGQPMSWKMSLESGMRTTGRWTLYFYVPSGTEKIGLYSSATGGQLLNPDGHVTLEFNHPGGEFLSVPVPEGSDGRLWKISRAGGSVRLLNVPPFLARTPDELILPADSENF